jgi:hypothetical protein
MEEIGRIIIVSLLNPNRYKSEVYVAHTNKFRERERESERHGCYGNCALGVCTPRVVESIGIYKYCL